MPSRRADGVVGGPSLDVEQRRVGGEQILGGVGVDVRQAQGIAGEGLRYGARRRRERACRCEAACGARSGRRFAHGCFLLALPGLHTGEEGQARQGIQARGAAGAAVAIGHTGAFEQGQARAGVAAHRFAELLRAGCQALGRGACATCGQVAKFDFARRHVELAQVLEPCRKGGVGGSRARRQCSREAVHAQGREAGDALVFGVAHAGPIDALIQRLEPAQAGGVGFIGGAQNGRLEAGATCQHEQRREQCRA